MVQTCFVVAILLANKISTLPEGRNKRRGTKKFSQFRELSDGAVVGSKMFNYYGETGDEWLLLFADNSCICVDALDGEKANN